MEIQRWGYHNPSTIRKMGIEALTKELGPVGMVRFIWKYDSGKGIRLVLEQDDGHIGIPTGAVQSHSALALRGFPVLV